MYEVTLQMPPSAGMAGSQNAKLPAIPAVGDLIKDINNRYYKIAAIVYRPFDASCAQTALVIVNEGYATSPISAINGEEQFGANGNGGAQ